VAILSVTIPFFALVLIGYLAATGILPLEAVPGHNTFVLDFALTALLFQFGSQTPLQDLLDPVVVWAVAGLVVLALAATTARRGGRSWLDASFGGLIAVLPTPASGGSRC
jgi:hypothetical protein